MGYLLQGTCSCGYESESVMEGVGFSFPHTGAVYEPAYCDHCKVVLSVNVRLQSTLCNSCRGTLHYYRQDTNKSEILKDLGLPRKMNWQERHDWLCPNCKEPTLSFVCIGL